MSLVLVGGEEFLIDQKHLKTIQAHNWWLNKVGSTYYLYGRIKGERTSFHRLITGAPKGTTVDHINGNTLDNRLSNLRICSHAENLRNRGKTKTNRSGFKGVCWFKRDKKWHAQITVNYKRLHLGYFSDKKEAARVYDIAARKYFGRFAQLNFSNTSIQNLISNA